jgi:hypothetical protein
VEDLDVDQIAGLLSELSEQGAIPKLDVAPKEPSYFAPEEVVFSTSAWLARVADVQIWLNLDLLLSEQDDPRSTATKLFDQLAPDETGPCFSEGQDGVLPTELGAQYLEARLSRAVTLRDNFWSDLGEGSSEADATRAWLDSWEEPTADEPLRIDASVATWKIYDFATKAVQGRLDLNPTYQRDFVWSNADSQMLIESILRGIPLPSIILAKQTEDQTHQIVDGKQRLTAILRFMAKHPDGLRNRDSMQDPKLYETDFAKFARKNSLRAADIRHFYFPFKTKKYPANDPLHHLSGKYYDQIRDEKIEIAGEKTTVADVFETASDYVIPVLIYRDTNVRDIHQVFRIYNQQGMKLNAEEIRNAVYNHLKMARLALFLSGDRPEQEMAPYVVEAQLDPAPAREILEDLRFGTTRFKRTKVLLWTLSTCLLPPVKSKEGAYRTPSTASHIDAFLDDIDERPAHPLRDSAELLRLASDAVSAIKLHSEIDDAWHPNFRQKKGLASKWEELPVVGSLCACFFAIAVQKEQLLRESVEGIRAATEEMVGPESTQNRTQWAHIAKAATSILEAAGIDPQAAGQAVHSKYGNSGMPALMELRNI